MSFQCHHPGLPSKTMHILQPLDTAVFRSLAVYYATITTSVWLLKPNHRLNIANYVPIFREAYTKVMTPENILASFKRTGIYPLGQEVLATVCRAAPDTAYRPLSPCYLHQMIYQHRQHHGWVCPFPTCHQHGSCWCDQCRNSTDV